MDLNKCLFEFITYQRIKNNSPATIEDYTVIIKGFIDYCGNIDSLSLTADIVNNYNIVLRGRLKLVSVRTYIRHVRVFINFCIKRGYCSDFYHDIIMPKSQQKIIEILTPDEIRQLLSCFDGTYYGIRNRAMILLMLDCGLRASEVITVKITDVNLSYRFIKVVGKGNKERIVPLGYAAANVLDRYLQMRPPSSSNFLFLSKSGIPLTRSVFKKLFKNLRNLSGINKLHPHLLRHTFATNYLLYSSGDIYQLSMLLGHSEVATTEIYLHYASYYSFMQSKKIFSYIDSLGDLDFVPASDKQ